MQPSLAAAPVSRSVATPFRPLHYAGAIFLGSYLLFQVQPLLARFILPWFGGSLAVWTTCLLFFQVGLVGGYAYAHALVGRVAPRRQPLVHFALLTLSLASLPIVPALHWKLDAAAGSSPALLILALLTATVGAPYVLLSSTSPLLQHWFERTRPGVSPYRLFALSNFGSLLGLLSYPFLVEPLLRLRMQATLWSGLYGAYVILCAACAVDAFGRSSDARRHNAPSATPAPAIALRDRLLWLVLSAAGTVALMATSNHMVQDVASVPLLWVLPLAVYLLTLVLSFERDRWATRLLWTPAFALVLPVTVYLLLRAGTPVLWKQVLVYSATLFAGCMVVHGELARRRPPAANLTTFYLHVAAGGALGGALVTFGAPALFDGYWEYQLALVTVWLLAGIGLASRARPRLTVAWAAGTVMLASALVLQIARARQHPVAAERNFYGVLRVVERPVGGMPTRSLFHNRELHGSEILAGPLRGQPVTYYGPGSGIALALTRTRALTRQPMQLGVIGLGTGTLAKFAQPGDRVRYYEIDPADIGVEQRWFGNVHRSAGVVSVVRGDGRISLETELRTQGPARFDVLVVDAFSGDAIPAHLLTREAFHLYLQHLKPDGLLAVHISNRHLDLTSLLRGLARDAGLTALLITDYHPMPEGVYDPSQWVLLPLSSRFREDSVIASQVDTSFAHGPEALWTDDYSNLLSVLRRSPWHEPQRRQSAPVTAQ